MSEEHIKKEGEQDSEADLFVVDPDDYQKTKKLETIHKTKQRILEIRHNRGNIIQEYHDGFTDSGLDIYGQHLAQAVSQYGSELYPLIEEALEKGTLEEDDLTTRLAPNKTNMELITFIEFDGRIRIDGDLQHPPEPNTMAIYRQLQRIQRKLGLGLELEEDKGPAEI